MASSAPGVPQMDEGMLAAIESAMAHPALD
jgi:hypothetical protein